MEDMFCSYLGFEALKVDLEDLRGIRLNLRKMFQFYYKLCVVTSI
jgi:hypothetical protein